MGIEDEDIRKVRDATDLVQIISGHLQLRKVGRRWQGLCPFHNEKSPSFSVNGEDGLYHCFGCQKSGDAITFVREIEHLDFVSAVEYLARKSGITLRYTDKDEGAGRRKRTQFHDAVDAAANWYHDRLLTAPDAREARSYLRSRGLDGDMVRAYKIGWAPDGWDILAQSLKVSRDVFVGAGLGFVNKRGRLQDHFRARIVFPIFDVNGAASGFGGRKLPEGEGPKYKNSSESTIYAKSRLLYGLNWSKDEMVRANEAIICEGYTDVIGFAQAGMHRAVATCGTALTEDHVRMLKRFSQRLVLAFDADAAGQAAAERIYEWERKYEVDVAVVRLPDGVDPADLARSDPEALAAAVEEAQPFLGFRVQRVLDGGNLDSAEGRARTAEQAMGVVREHPSGLVRDQYVMQVADACRVEPDRLRQILAAPAPPPQQERRGNYNDGPPPYGEPPPEFAEPESFDDDTETQVLRLAIHRPEHIPPYLNAAMFRTSRNQQVFLALIAHETLHDAIADASPAIGALLAQLAVLDEPDGEGPAIVGQLLYDSARRELGRLRGEAKHSPSPTIDKAIVGLQSLIPKVLDTNFDLAVAEELVAWLPTPRE